jgi:hypothetical protein
MSDCERDGSFEGAGRPEEKVWEYDGFAGYRVSVVCLKWPFIGDSLWNPRPNSPSMRWQRWKRNGNLEEL